MKKGFITSLLNGYTDEGPDECREEGPDEGLKVIIHTIHNFAMKNMKPIFET